VEEGFNINALIYSAIMYKVRSLYQVPLIAVRGDPGHPDALPPEHPLSKLVTRPNLHQSFAEFQGQNETYLNVDGNAYILFLRDLSTQVPEAMFSLRPDRVFIVPMRNKNVSDGESSLGSIGGMTVAYLYVPEGKSQFMRLSVNERLEKLEKGEVLPILPENMMHVKFPNPADPLEGMGYGMSPILPAAKTTDVDNKTTDFLKLFYDNGTMMQGIVSYDVPMDQSTMARVRETWMERFGGYQKWPEIAVLDQGGKYTRVAPTFDEMGFGEIDERSEARILGPFGVPPILIGSRLGLLRATYSNALQARQLVWEDTLVPEARLFEVDYKFHLRTEDAFVMYDFSQVPQLKKSLNEIVTAWTKLVMHGVPKDDATKVTGLQLPPLPDGKTVYMPVNLVPVTGPRSLEEGDTARALPSAEQLISDLEIRMAELGDTVEALPSAQQLIADIESRLVSD
jgi:HK97 family phage portal protein